MIILQEWNDQNAYVDCTNQCVGNVDPVPKNNWWKLSGKEKIKAVLPALTAAAGTAAGLYYLKKKTLG